MSHRPIDDVPSWVKARIGEVIGRRFRELIPVLPTPADPSYGYSVSPIEAEDCKVFLSNCMCFWHFYWREKGQEWGIDLPCEPDAPANRKLEALSKALREPRC